MDHRRARVREIAAELEDDRTLRDAQAEVERLQNALRPAEARITDLNLEIKTVSSQSTQLSDRLYSGKVSNPKELEDIQNKIAELKRRRETLENNLLETMITVDDLQTALESATDQLRDVETTHAASQKALKTERRRLKEEFQALKEDREAAQQEITDDNLELYKTLRSQKRGYAVAVLNGEICSACGVGAITTLVQRVRQGQELIRCSNCGRILIAL
jgi:predicted  nucleic acid-binding Zn-ribbon protein